MRSQRSLSGHNEDLFVLAAPNLAHPGSQRTRNKMSSWLYQFLLHPFRDRRLIMLITQYRGMNTAIHIAEDEILLYEHFDSSLIITNKRIRQNRSFEWGSPLYSSVLMSDITSIAIRKAGNVWLLWLGIIACLIGIFGLLDFQAWSLGALLAGSALTIIYYNFLEPVVEFRYPQGSIAFSTRHLSRQQIMELIHQIEQLKDQ
jgi:hypothetical protein